MRFNLPGRLYPEGGIPPLEECMVRIDAGAIQFGVEHRDLDPNILSEFLNAPGKEGGMEALKKRGLDMNMAQDEGASIHVFDRETGQEYLRFDMFREDPHYHYMRRGKPQIVIGWDEVAWPDFQGWVFTCLENRLPEMLMKAEADELATKVDAKAVKAVLPKMRQMIAEALEKKPAA